MPVHKFGRNCKVYTGTSGTIAATLLDDVIEVSVNITSDQIESSSRNGPDWKTFEQGAKDATIEITMMRKATAQTGYDVLRGAFTGGTAISLLVLDGLSSVADSQGLDIDVNVFDMSRPEPYGDAVKVTFSCKPCASARTPLWHDATGA